MSGGVRPAFEAAQGPPAASGCIEAITKQIQSHNAILGRHFDSGGSENRKKDPLYAPPFWCVLDPAGFGGGRVGVGGGGYYYIRS